MRNHTGDKSSPTSTCDYSDTTADSSRTPSLNSSIQLIPNLNWSAKVPTSSTESEPVWCDTSSPDRCSSDTVSVSSSNFSSIQELKELKMDLEQTSTSDSKIHSLLTEHINQSLNSNDFLTDEGLFETESRSKPDNQQNSGNT